MNLILKNQVTHTSGKNLHLDDILQKKRVCSLKLLTPCYVCFASEGKPAHALASTLRPWSHTAIIRPYHVTSSSKRAEGVHGITKAMTDNANYFFAEAANFGRVIENAAARRQPCEPGKANNSPVTLLFIAHNMVFDRWMLRYAFTLGNYPQKTIGAFFPSNCEVQSRYNLTSASVLNN